MQEIAGLDSYQLRHVYFRKRHNDGRLVRGDMPEGCEVDARGQRVVTNPVPFSAMFRAVKRRQGVDDVRAQREWRLWLAENPQFSMHQENA